MSAAAPTPSPVGVLPAPPGVTADPVNPVNPYSTVWVAGNLVCLIVPSVLIVLRLYVRLVLIKAFTLVDYICLLAWFFFIVLVAIAFQLLRFGIGLHLWDELPEQFAHFAEWINIQQIVYMPAILFTKVAILLQLVQIFVTSKKSRRWYIFHLIIALNILFFTIYLFLTIFACIPRQKIWNPTIPGSCYDAERSFIASSVINVFDDFLMLTLPIIFIWKLQAPIKKKIGISMIFASGLFACLSSVMRLIYSVQSVPNPDVTNALLPVSLWATAEISSGLVVCCLPVLPRLFAYNDSSPQHTNAFTTANSKGLHSRSRKDYVEMDRELDTLAFANVGAHQSELHLGTKDFQDLEVGEEAAVRVQEKPAILKTIHIDQVSTDR
ncbi:hypothetical protein MMC26_001782 [Xylographa opegraphella]|nr:hypothetical protein [Xylographa opegraphella]